VATALPALTAFLLAQRSGSAAHASSVAFGTVAGTGSAGLLTSTLTVGRLRALLGLGLPTRLGWSLIGSGAVAAVALSRLWTAADVPRRVRSCPELSCVMPQQQSVSC
jgi:hypothetical protein